MMISPLNSGHKRFIKICCILIALFSIFVCIEMYLKYDYYNSLKYLYVDEGRV